MAKGDRAPSETPVAPSNPLTRWKAQHAALGRLIESYEEAERIGALGGAFVFDQAEISAFSASVMSAAGASTFNAVSTTPIELPVGAFLNMSIPEAIKLYLSAVKKKQTAREIAVALKDGGMESTAANWETTVTGALHRLKSVGAVLRFKDGWGLADLYPDSLRARIAKEKPQRGRRKKAKPTPKIAKATTAQAPRRAIHLGPGSLSAEEKAS